MNKLLILLALLLVACGEATPAPTVPPAPTFDLPAGYVAYQNVTVIVVDISEDATQGAAAQEAIIAQALAQKRDVLVIGCFTVDASVSVCLPTPFIVFGSRVRASDTRAMR